NSQPTGCNNGRRMIYDQYTDIYHLVYEDNGKIFYTWSEDNGQNWSKETLLSGDGISKYPSIAGLYGRAGTGNRQVTELAVVWQEYEGYYLKIYMRRGIGVNWSQNTVMVDDLFNPEDPDAIDENFLSTPVISSRFVEPEEYYLLTIVYRYNFSSEYSGLNLSIYDTNDNDFIWNETIPTTNVNCLHPSVIFQQFSDIVIHIVWSVNGHIKYINADFEEDEPVFNSVKTISSGIGGLSQSSNPFITVDKNKSALVFWHGKSNWHDGIKVIVHRRRTETGSWSGVTYFGSDYYDFEYEYFNPSVSSHPFWDNNLTLSMYSKTQGENEYKIWKSKYTYNNNSWHDPEIIANDSKYPSSCIGLGYSFSTEKDKIAFTKYSNAPYFVKVFLAGNNLNKISRENTPLAFKKSRGISIIEKNNKFTDIVFDEPMFFNNSIQWLPLADSTNAIRFSELTSVLRSKTFPIKEDSDINLKYSIYGESKFFVDAFQLELVNAQSGSVLEKWSLSDIGDGIKIYKGKSVNKAFLQISCDSNLKQNSNLNAFLFNLYTVSASDTLHKNSKFVDNTKTNHIPDNYALYQNHPNPFNPITHITFDLPQAGDVKLDVYNIKGQKVSQVMHGFKEAGIYEVIFDGKGLASGVYFYRLEAGKFSAIKRMLLVK
ncbi:MAG: T9SS type A sorting domain-containing protein, partial [Calditrichales bacterium]|nr:T9SS type A sorting domain-containing protein [Calditrichales bacterium]